MQKIFQGKVALITGSSRGIGKATALKFAELGADIVVNYFRQKSAADQTVSEIEKLGQRAIAVKAQIGDPEELDRLFDKAKEVFGGIDFFISNAASGVIKGLTEITDKHWDWTIDINSRALFRGAKRCIELMAGRTGCAIVALTSIGSQRVMPGYGIVGVSKSAIETLVRYLAVELAPYGINVNAVSGGVVDTDALKWFPNRDIMLQEAAKKTPAGRIVEPNDLANVIAFLCSPDAYMIRGQVIVVDGGYSLLA
jgi:enoyl-[acyl-carrier protein] reductase III